MGLKHIKTSKHHYAFLCNINLCPKSPVTLHTYKQRFDQTKFNYPTNSIIFMYSVLPWVSDTMVIKDSKLSSIHFNQIRVSTKLFFF